MILEEYYDKNLETIDDSSVKIFKTLGYRKDELHNDDVFLDSDHSNTKIFTMSYRNPEQWESVETNNVQYIGRRLEQNGLVISG